MPFNCQRALPDRSETMVDSFSDEKGRPFLWFDGQAEEAARYYNSLFKNDRRHP
jgi:3-demethylubiquinone-9 3-methyltransferase